MTITLNGQKRGVPDGLTVLGLLRFLNIQTERVAVELNMDIVKKGNYDATQVKEGDSLEVVSFMAGGSRGAAAIEKCKLKIGNCKIEECDL